MTKLSGELTAITDSLLKIEQMAVPFRRMSIADFTRITAALRDRLRAAAKTAENLENEVEALRKANESNT
jgi:hypothetical protein